MSARVSHIQHIVCEFIARGSADRRLTSELSDQVMITFTHSVCRRLLPPAFKSNNQTENDWSHINSTNSNNKPAPHNTQSNCNFNRVVHIIMNFSISKTNWAIRRFNLHANHMFNLNFNSFCSFGRIFFSMCCKADKALIPFEKCAYAIQNDESEEWQVVAWIGKLQYTNRMVLV